MPLKGVSLGYLGRAFIITLRLGLCHLYLGRPGNQLGRPTTLRVLDRWGAVHLPSPLDNKPGQRSGGNPKPNSDVAQRAIVTRVTPQAAATHGGHVSPLRSSCSLPPRSTSPIQPPKKREIVNKNRIKRKRLWGNKGKGTWLEFNFINHHDGCVAGIRWKSWYWRCTEQHREVLRQACAPGDPIAAADQLPCRCKVHAGDRNFLP